jgi:two-component system response regulator FixJ
MAALPCASPSRSTNSHPAAVSEPTVFIVDDDQAVARSLRWLIETVRLRVETYGSAQSFIDGYDPARPGCLVLDVRMPGMSGLELQERLAAQRIRIPIIFITGHGDVQMAVRAVQAGAFDFVEKPFNDQDLLDRIQRAITRDAEWRDRDLQQARLRALFATLTPRESRGARPRRRGPLQQGGSQCAGPQRENRRGPPGQGHGENARTIAL